MRHLRHLPRLHADWVDAASRRELLAEVEDTCWRQADSTGPDYAALIPALLDGADSAGAISPLGLTEGRPSCAAILQRRRLALGANTVESGLFTAWAVTPELRGKGLGLAVLAETLRRARGAGLGGVIWFTVETLRTGAMSSKAARDCGWHVEDLGVRPWLARPLGRLAGIPPDAQAVAVDERAPRALTAASSEARRACALARVISPREATWVAVERPGAISCVMDAAEGLAVAAGWSVPLVDRNRSQVAFLDHAHWAGLPASGRRALLDAFCARARHRGAALAIASLGGGDDESPHRAAGFRATGQAMHAWLALDRAPAEPLAGRSHWVDVF